MDRSERLVARGPRGSLGALCAGLCLLGCGGKSSSSAETGAEPSPSVEVCGSFVPCGGAVVGRWRIESACLPSRTLEPLDCATDRYRLFDQQGTLELTGTGAWSFSNAYRTHYTRELSGACLDGMSCEAIADRAEASGTPFRDLSVSCSSLADGCRCQIALSGTTESRGFYQAAGSSLSFVAESGGSGTGRWDYCVDGDRLAFRTEDGTGGTLSRD